MTDGSLARPAANPAAAVAVLDAPGAGKAAEPAAAPATAPNGAPTTAGADLAKTHEGWLPPPSPTLVTEAKQTRRTPPVPVAETRAPLAPAGAGPASDEMLPGPSAPERPARADQPSVARVSQEAGPPRSQGRSPAVPAPWPESIAPPPLSPAPPYRTSDYQDYGHPPRQTSLREFQPQPVGAVSAPDGMPYQPLSPLPNPGSGRPNAGPMAGYPGSGGQLPPMPQQVSMPPQVHGGQRPSPATGHVQPPPNGAGPSQSRSRPPATVSVSVGKLTQPIPTKWRVSQSQLVEVRLGPEDLRALAQQLDGRGAAYAHEKIVAKAFSVRLKASDPSFNVEPTSPETLWLDAQTLHMSNDGAHWRWQATPQSSGKTKLQLVISARTIGADGVVAETALPDQAVTARVRANPARFAFKLLGYGALLLLGALIARYGEGGIETLLAWKRGFQ
jgi:neural Wiskott-Aldrich syndrome protein